MLAHIKDGREQSLQIHSENVSRLCKDNARGIGLERIMELIALLHDMGKGTRQFCDYLKQSDESGSLVKSPHPHAPTGAIYAYEHWFTKESGVRKMTAQMISLVVFAHHSGLMDCIDARNTNRYFESMEEENRKLHYKDAVNFFWQNIRSREQLDEMFQLACLEVENFFSRENCETALNKNDSFHYGMMTRLMLSLLVDADRWDSACFAYEESPFAGRKSVDWTMPEAAYNRYAQANFTGRSAMDCIREKISDKCLEKGNDKRGIYSLTVPTGGGKTFSSLRFALRHAQVNGMDRVFYVIPFNTILDQNAEDIRVTLEDCVDILEHHSGILDERISDKEKNEYKVLTERWDSDIILTSMVQFLNALFNGSNTNARRMHRLVNSVIIFDEVQAMPRRCKALFEQAVVFLTTYCRCSVLLCTATPMKLSLPAAAVDLMGDAFEIEQLYRQLKRVEYIPFVGSLEKRLTNQEAAKRAMGLLEKQGSLLYIANTKRTAYQLYEEMKDQLKVHGLIAIMPKQGTCDDEIIEAAAAGEKGKLLCIHLTTHLCPAHRKEYIRWMKLWMRSGGRVLCVSTALIEAGINISFPVVVRSLAGLPSIVQAAGRCNRHGELPEYGQVHIWQLADENLNGLPEIAQGSEISIGMIDTNKEAIPLDSPGMIENYFEREEKYTIQVQKYPANGDTLVNLLTYNRKRLKIMGQEIMPLRQSFAEAGRVFRVIDQDTKSVLVPYGKGKELIESLNGRHTLKEEQALLRKAQQYCVSLYEGVYRQLERVKALYPIGETGIVALKPEHYDNETGVVVEGKEMEIMIW